jgi:hypothetical protein
LIANRREAPSSRTARAIMMPTSAVVAVIPSNSVSSRWATFGSKGTQLAPKGIPQVLETT